MTILSTTNYVMMGVRKPIVEEEMSTKAAASLLRNHVEEAVHPFYRTRRILEWRRVLRLKNTFFDCGELRPSVHRVTDRWVIIPILKTLERVPTTGTVSWRCYRH